MLMASHFSLLELLASFGSGIALWAQSRKASDPVADLTERLRHPVRWSLTHPVQAIRRTLSRPAR